MYISAEALARLNEISQKEGKLCRLYIQGGGCSGFSYVFDVDDKRDDDLLIENILLIDPESYQFLENSNILWINDLTGSYFKVAIPEAKSFCGCGTSFSL
jgi:iron-sulfur cluster insertion protein